MFIHRYLWQFNNNYKIDHASVKKKYRKKDEFGDMKNLELKIFNIYRPRAMTWRIYYVLFFTV